MSSYRTEVIIAIILLIVIASGCVAQTREKEFRGSIFSLSYPSDWIVVDQSRIGEMTTSNIEFAIHNRAGTAFVTEKISEFPDGTNLTYVSDGLVTNLTTVNSTIIEYGNIQSIGNYDWFTMCANIPANTKINLTENTTACYAITLCSQYESIGFLLNVYADDYKKYKPVVENILESFRCINREPVFSDGFGNLLLNRTS